MKNIRFSQMQVGDCRYLKTRMRENDVLNNSVVDMIFDSSELHILPITCSEYEGTIEVLLGNYITIDKVLKNNVKRDIMLTIMFNLIKEISGLIRKGIKLEYLVLNKRYLYVNPQDLSIRFICIPVDNVEHQVDFNIFLRGLLASARYSSNDNLEYVGVLLNCINEQDYSNTKLIAAIRAIAGEDVGKPVEYDLEKCAQDSAYSEDTAIGEVTQVNMFDGDIEEEELAKFFAARVDKEKSVPDLSIQVKEKINEEVDKVIGNNVVGSLEEKHEYIPYLVRVSNREKIHIDQERFNIGKSEITNNYAINNERVSRNHCSIVRRNGHFYIKDNGSTNSTFVNSINIGEMAVELLNNTTIHIANEEFVFLLI